MDAIERFRLLFRYEYWANDRALSSIEEASHSGSAVRLFSHIVAAQEVWLTRLRGEDSSAVVIWPARSVDECRAAMKQFDNEIHALLERIDGDFLAKPITYRNQTGREFTNTPEDILTHLGLHSQHHRGQIALQLRQLGQKPAVTDFIAFRRLDQ